MHARPFDFFISVALLIVAAAGFGNTSGGRRLFRQMRPPPTHRKNQRTLSTAAEGEGMETFFEELQYPHWMMMAGAFLVVPRIYRLYISPEGRC